MKPVKLKPAEKKRVLDSLAKKTQIYRVVDHLSDNPRTPVGDLCQRCSAANIPDVALKHNEQLRAFGLAIGCHPAPVSYLNKHYQPTLQHEWSLCRLSKEELSLPTKGPNRPQVKDPNFKKRRKMIIELIDKGELLNHALANTRGFGITRPSI